MHYGSGQFDAGTLNQSLSHKLGSRRESKWIAAERASTARNAEQANECAVQANQQEDEQVAQYTSRFLVILN